MKAHNVSEANDLLKKLQEAKWALDGIKHIMLIRLTHTTSETHNI